MPISDYLRGLREKIGTQLILMPAVAAVVIDDEGRVLLQQRADTGLWGFPGGALDPGEEPARAVIREVWEEVGLRVIPERLIGLFGGADLRLTYPNGDEVEPVVAAFRCRVVGGEIAFHDGESRDARFFFPHDFPPLLLPYPRWLWERPTELHDAAFQWDPAWLDEVG